MGREPSEAEEGELNKSTGMPAGTTSKIRLQVGAVAIPNFSVVWAKKLGTKDKPTGGLEFMPWGAAGGEAVKIRYLQGCSSLDRQYQTQVLKLELTDEEKNESAYIDLDIGINDFNMEVTDPMLIEMLKHHTYCEDNVSRKKDSKSILFKLYNPSKVNASKIEAMRATKRATDYVLAAEGDTERLVVLANLFELDPQSQDEVIFGELLEILDDDSSRVLKVIDLNKAKFKHQLQSLEERKAIEYTMDGEIYATVEDERSLVGKVVDDEGKPVKDYIGLATEGIMEPEIYAIYAKVQEITHQLLQLLQ